MNRSAIRGFNKLCLSTLVAVYFLIMVGGIVRSTGSGMGCPDWPKCFGQWIPPSHVDELPPGYKEVYSQFRQRKNEKFAGYLRLIGMQSTAKEILSDKSIREEVDFNATKTRVEYINRLVGVAVGIFIMALCLKSLSIRKSYPRIFYWSIATLVTVIAQGWFGSIVVSTNLTAWTITIHMFLALVIIVQLMYLLHLSQVKAIDESELEPSERLKWLLTACMATLLIQIFFGTQVREGIDFMANGLQPRSEWVMSVGRPFFVHRTFSWLVLFLHLYLLLKLRKNTLNKTLSLLLITLILGTLLTGVGMAYFGIPPFLQPIHLVLATVTFGLQLNLFLKQTNKRKLVS